MARRTLALLLLAALSAAFPCRSEASSESDLAAAAAAGHPVFLVVTEAGAQGLDQARTLASEAQKLAPGTSVLELDRGDPANAAVVKRYRLASAPVPLILVIASNGVAAGAAEPKNVAPARLAGMVPSPAKASFLQALDERKASFLVFTRAGMPGREAALKAAADAAALLKGSATVVPVDLDDAREVAFVAEMKVDARAGAPTTVVYNAKGQFTGTFATLSDAPTLATAAQQQPKKTCKPGECGPGGCK